MYTISDVADLLSISRLKGGDKNEFQVECPYCGDVRGKCVFCVSKLGEIRNVFQCYSCGTTGNMLTLYADMKNLTGAERYKKAYQEIWDNLPYKPEERQQKNRETKQQMKKQKELASNLADEKVRDLAYRTLIGLLHLSKQHKADLRRRGLTEKEIADMESKGYKSTDASESESIARRLIKQGISLEGVPGFFINKNGNWEISFYKGNYGYLCPVYNEENLLIAFQIRVDHPIHKRKYVWLTSTKLERGCSPGSPVSISGNVNVKKIGVTEGILKAEVTHQCCKWMPMIGNPGVANHKELRLLLMKLKGLGLEEVYEFYDMDKNLNLTCNSDYDNACATCEEKTKNGEQLECPRKRVKRDNIRKGCLKLYDICEELSLRCRRMVWDQRKNGLWIGNIKGIDDWETRKREVFIEQKAA